MSLSLMTLLGYQKPTRDEKYICKEAVKILRFNKYPDEKCDTVLAFEKEHNETLEHIIEELKKILDRPIREDRVTTICEPEKSTRHCRCIEIPGK